MCGNCSENERWAHSGWLVGGRRQRRKVILYHARGDDLCRRQCCHVLQGFVFRCLILQRETEDRCESATRGHHDLNIICCYITVYISLKPCTLCCICLILNWNTYILKWIRFINVNYYYSIQHLVKRAVLIEELDKLKRREKKREDEAALLQHWDLSSGRETNWLSVCYWYHHRKKKIKRVHWSGMQICIYVALNSVY